MTASIYQTFGVMMGLTLLAASQTSGLHDSCPLESIFILVFTSMGSLLPGLDTASSRLGGRHLLFGYRTITHSLFFVVLSGIAVSILFHYAGLSFF